ncbi:MAG TPA: hypothetical protein PK005_05095 [Bacteroidales bacterium]|jgi:hypothetical protein|nr:hypothetical protein [Bacteroidales bacterium]MDI9533396.1 hypothetical protein [Bacteroidota bacterium]MBK7732799.1 hypothetical protein [Bacteroidales bacterium]MBP7035881.1 hypothetical protein [Bacteroidales bacterium]MBP8709168.1 hypothetical protein [Bacteroidales bacterium]
MEENAASSTVLTAEENRIKKHVNIAGILQIVFGSLLVFGALIIAVVLGFIDQFAEDPTAVKILAIISTPLVVLMLLFGAGMIAGGIGLFYCKRWARILTLVLGGIGLLNIPLGTLKGVYIIWVLVQPEAISLFRKDVVVDLMQV